MFIIHYATLNDHLGEARSGERVKAACLLNCRAIVKEGFCGNKTNT